MARELRPSFRRPSAVLAASLAAFTLAGAADAAPSKQRLEQALAGSGVGLANRSIVVVEAPTGEVVYARNPGRALRPASNEKLPVSIAALHRLGPDFRFETTVYGTGERDGATWRGNLILKGSGDPGLWSDDLASLAREIRARGIRRVEGRVFGDETRFDRVRTAPGWRASFYKNESAPLSALVVDWGAVGGVVRDDPARSAATLLRRQLAAHGVVVTGYDGVGRAPEDATPLASVRSARLARIVAWMNTQSDNFVAEMLLKELGAQAHGRGTTAGGAHVVRSVLAELGVGLEGVRIVDGSGLSKENRLTARALAQMLVVARRTPGLARPFFRSLAVAGRSGTLAYRLRGTPAHGLARGKTGTTRHASALSGYVGTRYVFAILMNGTPVPSWSARAGQDRFVTVLAADARARAGQPPPKRPEPAEPVTTAVDALRPLGLAQFVRLPG